jgi:hypothetical protein
VKRALYLLDQLRDIVQGKAWPEVPEITGSYRKGLPRGGDASIRQPAPQRIVDDVSERQSGTARFRLQLGRDVLVQGQRRSHALMLLPRHHDVNASGAMVLRPRAEAAKGLMCGRSIDLAGMIYWLA